MGAKLLLPWNCNFEVLDFDVIKVSDLKTLCVW